MRRRVVVPMATMAAVMMAATGLGACASDPDDSRQAAASATTAVAVAPTAGDVESSADGPTAETFPANGETVEVIALDNNFLPQTLTVAAGTEVVFSNNGRNDHDVIPVDDLETVSWGVQADAFAPKDVYSHVFGAPGTYPYFCTIHGTATAGMVGTIVVTAP